ncbi:uncharacterized protein LOC111591681 [Ceratitis capitata]|uniref:uncharacterized protein LOC111591681 n=1 Tax=Ceratitis capitata TaxID=7213 RepID=UPI000C6C6BBB|nr:uncharacterized protein LOC111591681 [Ceratitis capitata]
MLAATKTSFVFVCSFPLFCLSCLSLQALAVTSVGKHLHYLKPWIDGTVVFGTVGTVEAMRMSLRAARLIERRGSVNLFQDYPFSFHEDKTAVESKLEEVEKLILSVSGECKPQHGAKALAKIEWCRSRIGRARPGNNGEMNQHMELKSKLLLHLAELLEVGGSEESEEKEIGSVERPGATRVDPIALPPVEIRRVVEEPAESQNPANLSKWDFDGE